MIKQFNDILINKSANVKDAMKQLDKSAVDIKKYLEQYENISFAVVFGSFASGNFTNRSDLDIGIYTDQRFDLIKLGSIISDLEKITNFKIDLVELSSLYNKSPLLAYRIVTNHIIVFVKDEKKLINFKRRALLQYFDTKKLRESIHSALYNRISENKFGKNNYA